MVDAFAQKWLEYLKYENNFIINFTILFYCIQVVNKQIAL